MNDTPNDPPDTFDMSEDTIMSNEPEKPTQDTPLPPGAPLQNLVHFNPWRDFNDAATQIAITVGGSVVPVACGEFGA